ncbi:MAG: hypothetical protein M3Q45_08760 [Chloroflexota bacterium]|nr:hypothetical protein [Chloroflexota bacterium]
MLIEAVTAVAPVIDSALPDLRNALAPMAYLNDAALWSAARSSLIPEQRARLETLQHKQQREGLSEQEQKEEQAFVTLYQETLLVRAQAAVLLKQRQYDISDPTPFHPLNGKPLNHQHFCAISAA